MANLEEWYSLPNIKSYYKVVPVDEVEQWLNKGWQLHGSPYSPGFQAIVDHDYTVAPSEEPEYDR